MEEMFSLDEVRIIIQHHFSLIVPIHFSIVPLHCGPVPLSYYVGPCHSVLYVLDLQNVIPAVSD